MRSALICSSLIRSIGIKHNIFIWLALFGQGDQAGEPMSESEIIRAVLIGGAIGGAILSLLAFLLSRFANDTRGRTVFRVEVKE
jgi:hypothetical protein